MKFCICAEFLDTKLSEGQILRLPKVSQPKHSSKQDMYSIVIMVNYIPPFNFVYKLQCFQGYFRRKINKHRVLVLNLVETSKEYLIFIDLKILKPGLLPFRDCLLLLNKHFVRSLCATRVREH